jgi:predicted DNA-binding transcriptional regulator AlpA
MDVEALLANLEDLPAEQIPAALAALAGVQTKLAAKLLRNGNGGQTESDRLLTAREAASLVGVSADWLYDHGAELPFVVRLPMAKAKKRGKTGETKTHLRFSAHGIEKWIRQTAGR